MHALAKLALGGAVAGAACFAYAATYEVNAFRLRRLEVPVLPVGSRPLRLLHVSDLHLTPDQRPLVEWTRSLADLAPDLVVNTGDNLGGDAVDTALEALQPLLALPGVFVFGSNDYYAPTRKNPLRYLYRRGGPSELTAPKLPYGELRHVFADAGWLELTNARAVLEVDGRRLAFTGVDDPHIRQDAYPAPSSAESGDIVAGRGDLADGDSGDLPNGTEPLLRIGVTHAPYRRVLDAMSADGHRLLLAGHTHGGQVCLPGWGALVSNCDLDVGRASGLSRYAGSWLHVSAGLGTSPTSRYRFACPPEASLLTLVPVDGS